LEYLAALKRWWPASRPARILAGVLAGYILLFFWLACLKFAYARAESGDIAVVNHVFWSSLHGKFFWHHYIDRSYFAMHQELLIFLIWPLYALVPKPQTLFLVQSFCIAISAVPMFLIARRVLKDEWSALLLALALIFFPTIVSQNVNQLHTSQWVLPLLLACFWFFLKQDFRWFTVFCILAALGKENTPLTLLVFVPYALWHRRSPRWYVMPTVVSACSLVLSFKIIGPYFARGWQYEALGYLSNLGNTWPEVFAALLSPKLFDALFQPANGPYLLYLLQPAVWLLPFLAPEIIFVAPDLGTNLIAGNIGMKVPVWHYNVYTGAFLTLANVFAIARLEQWLRRLRKNIRLCPVLPALVCAFAIAHWTLWLKPDEYRPLPHYETQVRARQLIPPGASVLVGPNIIVGHFSDRLEFKSIDHVEHQPERMFQYQYAYFDLNYHWYPFPVPPQTLQAFRDNPDYELIFDQDNVLVFRRRPDANHPPRSKP
jgi:uncharacterized membrane protein